MAHPHSDKALSVLTFAAYHSLASGNPVREIVLDDDNGHKADPDGVKELVEAGLLEDEGKRGRLTADGEAALAAILEKLRGG
ncbi:MAG: hypothetical protein DI629_08080 [Mesorhizobium amorphae]|nr:MAG: hypothetical protein DI629_08080 [Mesorhizobium amorphae]